ncbi:MAG TPA: hypothetical protein VLC91_11160 [Spongiibacteraceae bacterium]|nr:hypothetical protein [Spongiibacteraceae bacterium]
MQTNTAVFDERLPATGVSSDVNASAAAWGAILAGAGAAAALSLALLTLGLGLGMSVISPWSEQGLTAGTAGVSALVWVFITQVIASAIGGYLAGRLRVRWADVHTDEVYFRDTAHGFLTWAIASLATVALLGAAATAALNGGLQAGAKVASTAAGAAVSQLADTGALSAGKNGGSENTDAVGYFVDNLFRSVASPAEVAQPVEGDASGGNTSGARTSGANNPAAVTAAANTLGAGSSGYGKSSEDNKSMATEATTILVHDLRAGELTGEDRQRLGQMISQRTGLGRDEAEKRATDVYYKLTTSIANAQASAKDAADKARKAAAHTSLWLFAALLCGAFSASYSATLGGRERDRF